MIWEFREGEREGVAPGRQRWGVFIRGVLIHLVQGPEDVGSRILNSCGGVSEERREGAEERGGYRGLLRGASATVLLRAPPNRGS